MRVAELYLSDLYEKLEESTEDSGSLDFKLAHAEGACAVFRDLGMLSVEDDIGWRTGFRTLRRQK